MDQYFLSRHCVCRHQMTRSIFVSILTPARQAKDNDKDKDGDYKVI
jgi:hypothetical protein